MLTKRQLVAPLRIGSLLALGTSLLAQTEGWRQIQTAHTPGDRALGAMAFDEARGQMVLFGGPSMSNDTWTYDGTDWQQRSPTRVPVGRDQHCMAYDPIRQRVLMYGGRQYLGTLDDTWEWTGSDWTQVGSGADSRLTAAMAFDPVRQQMLRYGGTGPGGVNSETRAWNGSQWVLLTSGGPAPREMVAIS